MDEIYEGLAEDLRKSQEGEVSVFFGAGTSYDFGIHTMKDMATTFIEKLQEGTLNLNENDQENLISMVTEENQDLEDLEPEGINWNIENLLTRLSKLKRALDNELGSEINLGINENTISKESIRRIETELIEFMVDQMKLSVAENRGDVETVEYLADFIQILSEFQNKLFFFTTNNDLCIEAALTFLSQRSTSQQEKEYTLIDGFSHGLVPTFSVENYEKIPEPNENETLVFLWKLHGSIDWTYYRPLDEEEGNTEFDDAAIISRKLSEDKESVLEESGIINPPEDRSGSEIIIFPTPQKYSETYSNPYLDLLQSFRDFITETEILIAAGTSFPDKHINSVIRTFIERDDTKMYTIDPNLDRSDLVNTFGDSKSIKNVLNTGFGSFIGEFRSIL